MLASYSITMRENPYIGIFITIINFLFDAKVGIFSQYDIHLLFQYFILPGSLISCLSILQVHTSHSRDHNRLKKVLKQAGIMHHSKSIVSLLCMPYQKGNTQ